jgi:anti-sigma factor ChrR (cupin superfamily)
MSSAFEMPPASAYVEVPGLPGLRIARVGQNDGTTLEVVQAVKGVVVPATTHPGTERGRVVSGALRFMQDGRVTDLRAGDGWETAANEGQGPHVVLEDGTCIVVIRDGRSGYDN